jgi:antitoxin HicB
MTLAYRINLSPDDNDTLLITVPALPEVVSFADDADAAQVHACDAIEEALAARMAYGQDIPPGDAAEGEGVAVPVQTEREVELYRVGRSRSSK